MQLPIGLHEVIDRLAEEGNRLCGRGQFAEAIEVFRKGLDILPKPVDQWEAGLWFVAAIGDTQFLAKDYRNAADSFRDALLYGGIGNAFIHKRRGQTLYELGERKEAANELLRALLLDGEQIFNQEGDAKYFKFVTSVAKPPAGRTSWKGWEGVEKSGPVYEWLMDSSAYELRPKPRRE